MCTINKDSWDIKPNRQKFLSFWVIFCPFIPLANQKTKILKKLKIIWCMVPEIWSTTGKTFSNFGTFFVLLLKNQNFEKKACRYHQLTFVYHKRQSYDIWFLRDKVQRTEFWGIFFALLTPIRTWTIKILIKWKKKISGDIINCTINT